MAINKKIFILFSTLFIVLLLLIYFILNDRKKSAIYFENQLVQSKVSNLYNIFQNRNALLNNISYEYSMNDSVINYFKYKEVHTDKFFDVSSKLNISFFLLLDDKKDIVYSEVFDTSAKEYLDIDDSTHELFKQKDIYTLVNDESKLKFMTIDYERYLFSIQKVDDLGYIFVARAINSDFLTQLSNVLNSYVSLLPSYDLKDSLKEKTFSYSLNRNDKKSVYAVVELKDKHLGEKFYLNIRLNRDYYNKTTDDIKNLMTIFFLAFLILNFVIYLFISKIFTDRIENITNTVKSISKQKEFIGNIDLVYNDEITYLSRKMNEMFKIISESQNESIKKERDFLQSVLDSQQHIIFITDGSEIHSANKKFLDIFEDSNLFMSNIAIIDNKAKANLLQFAKKYSSIDRPAKFKFSNDNHKYFVFDISRVEIQKYIICMNDVSKYNERIVELENKASIDDLTNCYNKNTIINYCKYWLDIKDFGLIVLDIDKFKSINDTYGHYVGDCILKQLSSLLRGHLHSDDLIGRFGGEEFIIAINSNVDNLMNIANRLRVLIEDYTFKIDEHELKITASLGCTFCYSGEEFEELFKVADEALYHAKNTGRNRAIYKK